MLTLNIFVMKHLNGSATQKRIIYRCVIFTWNWYIQNHFKSLEHCCGSTRPSSNAANKILLIFNEWNFPWRFQNSTCVSV